MAWRRPSQRSSRRDQFLTPNRLWALSTALRSEPVGVLISSHTEALDEFWIPACSLSTKCGYQKVSERVAVGPACFLVQVGMAESRCEVDALRAGPGAKVVVSASVFVLARHMGSCAAASLAAEYIWALALLVCLGAVRVSGILDRRESHSGF